MMDNSNLLQTIAEISIAFAGFSGLIVALRKTPGPLTDVQKFRLQVLLWLALGALFLSLFPGALRAFGAANEFVWSVSAVAVVAYSLNFNFWWIYKSRRVAKAAPEIFNWFAFSRMTAGHIVIIALQLFVLLTARDDLAAGAFLVALIWYLLHAAQQFCRMLFVQAAEQA